MKKITLILSFFLCSSLCFGGEWFVAPDGDDTGPGTKDKPFATLVRARDAVRTAKPTDTVPHIVRLAQGVYELTETVVFDERDSGTVYVGEGSQTILSGGRSLSGWKKESNEVWSVTLPQENGRDLYFEQIFVNGRRAVRARTPNNGFFRPQDVQQDLPINARQQPQGTTGQAIMPQKGDLDFLKTTPQEELRFGQFVVHHNWDTTRRILLGYDKENDLLLMKGEPMKYWNPWRISSLYYIENVRAAFDAPGEWFYDGVNRKALYRPLPDEKLEDCRFIVPRSGLNQLILVKGKANQRVANIRFEKISFAYTDSPRRENLMRAAELDPAITGDLRFPGPGQINPQQSAFWADAVIDVENAEKIAIVDCEITNIGEYAIWIKNSDGCRVEHCVLTELGAGGVRIGGVGSSNFNVIDNCIIHRGGRLHAAAAAVWLGQGTEDNQVTHNDIGDFYHIGISAGWNWGYTGGVCFRNKIEFNRVHDIGQGVLADVGAIYTLGSQHGTRICNNVIFNIKAYSYGGWGLYPDEGSEGLLMENNLVYDTTDGSFHQHFGKNNTVRNNILAFSTPHQVAVSRVEPHLSITFENNIVYWAEGKAIGYQGDIPYGTENKTLGYRADQCQADYRSNLWYCVTEDGKQGKVDFNGKTHKEWQEMGKDIGGIIADPMFIDPKNRDFRLKDDSPARKIGFISFDYSKAGVYGNENWIRRAKDFVPPIHPNVPPPPKPLPLKVADGFETPRHTPLLKGIGDDEGRNLIRLSKNRPAQGELCLEIVYAPGLKAAYNPHINYRPEYEQGRVRIAFSLRMQTNAEVDCELRDRSNPYKVGPRFRVAKGKILLEGAEPISCPVDEWVRYEIITHVGNDSTGDWTLRLTFADGTKKELEHLKFRHADWRTLYWFGFGNCVKTTDQTTYYLDDIEIGNE